MDNLNLIAKELFQSVEESVVLMSKVDTLGEVAMFAMTLPTTKETVAILEYIKEELTTTRKRLVLLSSKLGGDADVK